MTAPVFHRADELKVEGYTLQVALPATCNRVHLSGKTRFFEISAVAVAPVFS